MSKHVRRVGEQGFQVEGDDTMHKTFAAARDAAGMPSDTYWDGASDSPVSPSLTRKRFNWEPWLFGAVMAFLALLAFGGKH